MESISVRKHTSDKQNRTTAKQESDLLITSMITDRIGRHKVLQINQNSDKILGTYYLTVKSNHKLWNISLILSPQNKPQ